MSINLGLQRIIKLLKLLGNPHLAVPIVHIAGTNGKGSVSAYLDAILLAAGLRTGRYNSPHLVQVHDAVSIAGQAVDKAIHAAVALQVETINKQHATGASPFELQTATAFKLFQMAEPRLDLAVVEVGMGGLTDATNVVPGPLLSIITSIDLDHQAFLGDTLEEIAAMKAGIIKENCSCLIGPQSHPLNVLPVLQRIGNSLNSPLTLVECARDGILTREYDILRIKPALLGPHQLQNATVAVWAADLLQNRVPGFVLTLGHIETGLKSAKWPGRLDWLEVTIDNQKVPVLVDGAHNPSSALVLAQYLAALPQQEVTLIIALSANRPPSSILEPLLSKECKVTAVIATSFAQPDQMPWVSPQNPQDIAQVCQNYAGLRVSTATDVHAALLQAIRHNRQARIVIAGSLYLAADVFRTLTFERNKRP